MRLFESFPDRKARIERVFSEYYANASQIAEKSPSSSHKLEIAKSCQPSTPTGQESEYSANHRLPSFDILLSSLRAELGPSEFLEFFNKNRTGHKDQETELCQGSDGLDTPACRSSMP